MTRKTSIILTWIILALGFTYGLDLYLRWRAYEQSMPVPLRGGSRVIPPEVPRVHQPVTPAVISGGVISPPVALSGSFKLDRASVEDHAGTWGHFFPGPGNINQDPVDWKWELKLALPSNRTITAIQVEHLLWGEGWSTSNSPVYGKQAYPLVVFYHGKHWNTAYDKRLGMFHAGTHTFYLFGQKESTRYSGARATILFADGTTVIAEDPSPLEGESSPFGQVSIDYGQEQQAMSKEARGSIWVSVSYPQCTMGPWGNGDPGAYLKKQGIDVYSSRTTAENMAVCEACGCPPSETTEVLIDSSNREKFEQIKRQISAL